MSDPKDYQLVIELKAAITLQDKEIARLKSHSEEQSKDIRGYVEQKSKLEDEIARLKEENERIEKEAACAAHNADKYHDIIREQRADNTRQAERIAELEAQVEGAEADNTWLRAEIRRLRCPHSHELADWCECGWSRRKKDKSND